jgi:intergrase/recombinase
MTEHKYTDEQIIEALEVRMPHDAVCKEAYDLIQRQKSEIARKICCEIEKEIVAALESNYKAKAERFAKPVFDMADEFISYCEGKIAALRCIESFIEELKVKYTEGKDTNVPPKKDFFTPDDVRKMSRAEVKKNYHAIMKSIKEW